MATGLPFDRVPWAKCDPSGDSAGGAPAAAVAVGPVKWPPAEKAVNCGDVIISVFVSIADGATPV